MPISELPQDWQQLELETARILRECGLAVEPGKTVSTVRGNVHIDVYAEDRQHNPNATYLCECKHWSSKVTQQVVHAFRTVVDEAGAHFGLLISANGFQSGAIAAASKSNIKLLNWAEFQEDFLGRWIANYFLPEIEQITEPLIDYVEPINTRVFRKANKLSDGKQRQFAELRKEYEDLAWFARLLYCPFLGQMDRKLTLPISAAATKAKAELPDDLVSETLYRPFLRCLKKHLAMALAEFDEVFGERA